MRFIYSATLRYAGTREVVVSFRDLPECLTSGSDTTSALAEAADALEEAIAARITDDEPIPEPSDVEERSNEYAVAVPPAMAAKAALVLAFRSSGLSQSDFARRLGVNEKVVRRMLDPRHRTATSRIGAALRVLGRELVLESQPVLGTNS